VSAILFAFDIGAMHASGIKRPPIRAENGGVKGTWMYDAIIGGNADRLADDLACRLRRRFDRSSEPARFQLTPQNKD
jgi:hypothetical protein